MPVIQGLLYNLHILEAMAFNRKDAMDFVESQQNEIIKHLIKIAIYNENDREAQIKHWQNEILGWLEQSDDKGNNIKRGNHLKLRDYKLCLNNDLHTPSRITRLTRIVKRELAVNRHLVYDDDALFNLIYQILLAQYVAMADDKWGHNTLIQNKNYITLCKGQL